MSVDGDKKTKPSGLAGEVRIADDVVAVIAALAAQEVDGSAIGSGGIGKTIMSYVGMKKADQGVRVEVSEGVVKADLEMRVKYGFSIPEVSKKVQEKVRAAIENMTGLKVSDVNIRVVGVEMVEGSDA